MEPNITLTVSGNWVQWIVLLFSIILFSGAILSLINTVMRIKVLKMSSLLELQKQRRV